MSKRIILAVISSFFSIGSIIITLLESKYKDEDMKNEIDRAVEERLKNVTK